MDNNEMRYRINKLMDDSDIDPDIINNIGDDSDLLNKINETLLVEKEKNNIINDEISKDNDSYDDHHVTNVNTNNIHQDRSLINSFVEFKDESTKDIDNIHSTLDLYENIIIKNQEEINLLKNKIEEFDSLINEKSNLNRIIENHNLLKDSLEIMQENVDNIVGKFTEHKENTIITVRELDCKIEKITNLLMGVINKFDRH